MEIDHLPNWANGIWEQSVEGGEPHRVAGLPEEKLMTYGWSRNGKYLAFTRGKQSLDAVLITEFSIVRLCLSFQSESRVPNFKSQISNLKIQISVPTRSHQTKKKRVHQSIHPLRIFTNKRTNRRPHRRQQAAKHL
jgi:hypothetical protein